MIRDCTGLNEARDGSMPEKDTLVGLQKMQLLMLLIQLLDI